MAPEDPPIEEGNSRETTDEPETRSEPEFEHRRPALWDELGLEPADDLPVSVRNRDDSPEADLRAGAESTATDDDVGRPIVMSVLSHLSVMFGVPVFLVPLMFRTDELSLHHAKAAAAAYFAFYGLLAGALLGWTALTPVAMVLYFPALVGIYRAVQRREAGWLGFGPFGEALFPWPKMERRDR